MAVYKKRFLIIGFVTVVFCAAILLLFLPMVGLLLRNFNTSASFHGKTGGRSQSYECTFHDKEFLSFIRRVLTDGRPIDERNGELSALFERTSFPKSFYGFAMVFYEPGLRRLLVVRNKAGEIRNIARVINGVIANPSFRKFNITDPNKCRIQIDFILGKPQRVDFKSLSETIIGDNRFEVGVDGLLITSGKSSVYFLPGDAFVKSCLTLKHISRYIKSSFKQKGIVGNDYKYYRFRTKSYVSFCGEWLRLYRGYPILGDITAEDLRRVVQDSIQYLVKNQEKDGRFLYYYDAAGDSFRDHEHPKRDPEKNPYYNMLRHAGGAELLLYDYNFSRNQKFLSHIDAAIDYLVRQIVVYNLPNGQEAAYLICNHKGKLGGSGIALHLLAEYQHITGSNKYEEWADLLSSHLLSQITESGEFMYYYTYLDKLVDKTENKKLFNFYYPGEAIIGLVTYYKYVAKDKTKKALIVKKLRLALDFLIFVRPKVYSSYFLSLPSDSWLMMAINELWDIPEMRDVAYKEFVFKEADMMIGQMYKNENSLYPDYPGSFYYNYGDFPYADGARCEGLLGAYELALKTESKSYAKHYYEALKAAAWATMHLVNTPESTYSVPRPDRAIGGIRFKHTRQWFRVDAIQHVAVFYLKFLPYWYQD